MASASASHEKDITPLYIKTLRHYPTDHNDDIYISSECGHYEIIQRLITASQSTSFHADSAEIETCLERFVSAEDGSILWHRVVVRTGPTSPHPVVHSSFMLPEDSSFPSVNNRHQKSLLCWTAFPDRPHHSLLCVLANPTLLCIWDVYPYSVVEDGRNVSVIGDGLEGGEGYKIPLPFEACAIFGVGNGEHGLLLQRCESTEDIIAYHNFQQNGDANNNHHDDDGFILKAPPRPRRFRDSTGSGSLNASAASTPTMMGGGGLTGMGTSSNASATMLHTNAGVHNELIMIPSLFSLYHPQGDILPVSSSSAPMATMEDVFEKILYTGVVTWVNESEAKSSPREFGRNNQAICVTYHTQKRRHAIWEIHPKGPPPPEIPLWQLSKNWRSKNSWDSHLGVLQQDLEDFELVDDVTGGADHFFNSYHESSRNDALANALGVKRSNTPRGNTGSSSEATATNHHHQRSARSSNVGLASSSTAGTNHHRVNKNVSLLSPLSTAGPGNEEMNASTPRTDVAPGDNRNRTFMGPARLGGPFGTLHPKTNMTCIFVDSKSIAPSENIFLASNTSGSGTLSLCLVSPSGDSPDDPIVDKQNPKTLTVFSFSPKNEVNDEKDNHDEQIFQVRHEGSVPCAAAQPIESSIIPKNYEPHLKNSQQEVSKRNVATDILVLKNHIHSGNKLSLYRNTHHIADCAISPQEHEETPTTTGTEPFTSVVISDLKNSFQNIIDVVYRRNDTDSRPKSLRGRLSLSMEDFDSVCEIVLQTVEAAIESLDGVHALALKARADCNRLLESVSRSSHRKGMGVEIVRTVVLALFRLEILGMDVNDDQNNVQKEAGQNQKTNSSTSNGAWDQLVEEGRREFLFAGYDALFGLVPAVANDDDASGGSKRSPSWAVSFDELTSIGSLAVQHLKARGDWSIVSIVFDSLHLLYEEMKLHNCLKEDGMEFVGSILCESCNMASQCKSQAPLAETFLSYYSMDMPSSEGFHDPDGDAMMIRAVPSTTVPETLQFSSFSSPPSIMGWIEHAICGDAMNSRYYKDFDRVDLNTTCRRIRSFLLIFSSLFAPPPKWNGTSDGEESKWNRDYQVIKLLLEEGFTNSEALRDELPVGISLPLLELLYRCRTSLTGCISENTDSAVWALIGRNDVHMKLSTDDTESLDQMTKYSDEIQNSSEMNDDDGVTQLELTSAMLFPDDNRMREVGRLLRSSKPIFLRVPRAVEVTDHDYERQKQEKLLLLSRRALALPLGRGMLTIGNLRPVPAEPLPLPDLCLTGRIPPTNTTMALDTSECPVDMKVWPEFHNGVAAGLRLPLQHETTESISKITRTWIVYNRPSTVSDEQTDSQNNQNNNNTTETSLQANQNHAHGGLLMALGMRGHLTALEMTDIFDYLTHGSVTTTVGCLLGMATNMRGSCDISVSKMLCLHIPSLIPQHFSTIDVASTVQAAAVAGAGLLYEGSSHRMMTEFLLNEIGKRPCNDGNVLDREAYTLACGIALGMVNLCKGSDSSIDTGAGLADLRIEERLYRYIVGGIDDSEMHRRYEETDRLSLPSSSTSNGNDRCSCIYEGDSINVDVTAPGATLALGLIFMKSGNQTIASAIALPDTHFLLEYVRPDFLMFRVISRALILWDEVEATNEWIQAQIPKAVYNAFNEMGELAVGIQRGDINTASVNEKDYDRQAVRYIYTHVLAAACFSIGLRFAGTGNTDAASVVFDRVMELRDLRDGTNPTSTALRPPTPVLEMCLGCAAISLGMILAGTGNLDALRLLKMLRWPCNEDVHYGSHQAYAIAIGLLFLGGGTCTLGREPNDIAALIMAFYPRFPSSTSDNQYHLQALRNLYALAVKKRELKAIDVDTGECVFTPIQLHFHNKSLHPLDLTAPCLLLNTDEKPCEIRVVSTQYYPLTIPLSNSPREGKVFYVKRRSTSSSTNEVNPTSLLIQFDRLQGVGSSSNYRDPLDLVNSFTDDHRLVAFAKHFCDFSHEPRQKTRADSTAISLSSCMGQFCSRILNECLLNDTQEALPLYLHLWSSVRNIHETNTTVCDNRSISSRVAYAWDFRLIRSYYQRHYRRSVRSIGAREERLQQEGDQLLNYELLAYVFELLEFALIHRDESHPNNHKLLSVLYEREHLSTFDTGTMDCSYTGFFTWEIYSLQPTANNPLEFLSYEGPGSIRF